MVGLLMGFILSVTANLVFLFIILFLLKPEVTISDQIANYKINGIDRYAVKVVNKSYFSAYDVEPALYVVKLIPANPSGYHKDYISKIEFKKVTSYLGRRTFFDDKTGKHEYASWYITFENLKDLIEEENTMLEFRISLKHELSNLARTQEKQYSRRSNIKEGQFVSGKKYHIE